VHQTLTLLNLKFGGNNVEDVTEGISGFHRRVNESLLRSVNWYLVTDVLGQTTSPIFNGHAEVRRLEL
jgi:hypothetical protein